MKYVLIVLMSFCVAAAAVKPLHAQESLPAVPAALTLEPHMVNIVLNDEHRQGVDWEAIVSDFHAVTLKNDDGSAMSRVSVGTVSDEDYAVLLDALDAVGQVSQSEADSVALNNDAQANVGFPEGKDKDKVAIRVRQVKNNRGGRQLVIELGISGRSVTTTVDLKENATVVLGSIFSVHEVTKTKKFPLLGDIPIVGLVFRSKGKLMQKTETVVFLSAKG